MIKKLLKDYLFHFFIFAAPAYIALSYRIKEIMTFNIDSLEFIGLLNTASNHRTELVIFIAFVVPLFFTFLKRLLDERSINNQETFYRQMYDVSGKIFVVLNDVLSIKRKAVLNCLSIKEKNTHTEIELNDVIKPTEQMSKIFEGLMYIFKKLTNNDHIKVSIIECKEQKMHKYLYKSDDDARTEISELNEKRSTAKQCCTKKRLVIYDSTANLIRRNWFYGDKTRIKSIMSYPVMSGKKILFVISVTSKEENTFKEVERKKYELIFDQLSYRLMLESYLSSLLKKQNDEQIKIKAT